MAQMVAALGATGTPQAVPNPAPEAAVLPAPAAIAAPAASKAETATSSRRRRAGSRTRTRQLRHNQIESAAAAGDARRGRQAGTPGGTRSAPGRRASAATHAAPTHATPPETLQKDLWAAAEMVAEAVAAHPVPPPAAPIPLPLAAIPPEPVPAAPPGAGASSHAGIHGELSQGARFRPVGLLRRHRCLSRHRLGGHLVRCREVARSAIDSSDVRTNRLD